MAAARMLINDMTTPPPEIRLQWGQEELYQPACQYLHTVDTLLSFSPLHQSAFSPSLVTSIKCSARTLAAAAMHFMELTTVCISCSISVVVSRPPHEAAASSDPIMIAAVVQMTAVEVDSGQDVCCSIQSITTLTSPGAGVKHADMLVPGSNVSNIMATLSCREHSTNTDGIIHQAFLPGHCTQHYGFQSPAVTIIWSCKRTIGENFTTLKAAHLITS